MEHILSIAALTKGLYTVVAYSLLGSVLSNLLLVLGACTLPSSALAAPALQPEASIAPACDASCSR